MTEHRIDLATLPTLLAERFGSHSIFGPSSSAMWLTCAGSLIPNILAEDAAGEDAAYGTVAHGVTETWLIDGRKPKHLVGTIEWVESGDWGYLITIDEVMLDHARTCVEWVELLPGDHFVERKVDFSRITPIPNQRGTADFIACEPGHMVVADWKFGKGYVVYAKYEDFDDLTFAPWMINSQLALYALGAFYEFDDRYHFKTIEIRVAQPRLDHFDTVVITREQLLEFAAWVKFRAALAWQHDAPRTPSPRACQWCKVKSTCAASAKLMADLTAGVFDNLDSDVTAAQVAVFKDEIDITMIPSRADVMTLTTEQMATIYPWRKFVESWWKSVEEELYRRACLGQQIPGQKLVEGKSNRVFRFPCDAGEHLVELGVPRDKVFVQDVCSPAQAEELLVKNGHRRKDIPNLLEGFVFKPPGKPTLAPLHDKRPALVDVTGAAFGDLTQDDEAL